MSRMRGLVIVAGLAGPIAPATAQFAQPVPPDEPDNEYGAPDRIGANLIANDPQQFAGREVDACGRVGQVDPRNGGVLVGNNLLAFMPPGIDVRQFEGLVICVDGVVELENLQGATVPTIEVGDPRQQVAVIGGPGHYQPPSVVCAPNEMCEQGRCVPRWRAGGSRTCS